MAATSTSDIDIDIDMNINDFVQTQGNGVKGLADIGIKALPKQYIHPPEKRLDMNKVLNKGQDDHFIPVIDMSSSDRSTVERLICEAAKTWGFFQVINHGVPLEVMEDIQAAAYRFFELPVEEKRAFLKAISPSEFVKYGTSFVPHFERCLEWKDYLSMTFVSEDEARSVWPIACRNEALEYLKSTSDIISQIFEILMRGLNVNEIENKKSRLANSKALNLNFYPKCPEPELTVGVGPHSDVQTFTVLLQDDVGGLYVRGPDGESWVNIPPIKGALIFNIGDTLQILSNGIYKSAEHRVVANASNCRVSIPIFVGPSFQETIYPFPEVLEEGEKPKYKDIVYLDYVKHFLSNGHEGKVTIDFVKA
ncbi:hypothetical protein RND81_05G143900 [Saponaria officinalis]|uniref:Fe2OG dioxygenase domain-containing protein n=1 Tax=Saponaria officinalis TaxID=3572 RepID=A0AAW1L0W2_SAPOF